MRNAYAIAFDGSRFLMVMNPRRGGWEMPGGKIEPGESAEDAARREFREEAGREIELVGRMDLGSCAIFAAVLAGSPGAGCEMESGMFSELPSDLAFDRAEYEAVLPWARRLADGKRHEIKSIF